MVTAERRAVLQRASTRSAQLRTDRVSVRHELVHGVIPPAAAVHDDRAGSFTSHQLARCVRGIGPSTATQILFRLNIPETKRVRDLTPRQKDRLAALLEVIGR